MVDVGPRPRLEVELVLGDALIRHRRTLAGEAAHDALTCLRCSGLRLKRILAVAGADWMPAGSAGRQLRQNVSCQRMPAAGVQPSEDMSGKGRGVGEGRTWGVLLDDVGLGRLGAEHLDREGLGPERQLALGPGLAVVLDSISS